MTKYLVKCTVLCSCSMPLEFTLALIKPHVLKLPFAVQVIQEIILKNGFCIVRSKNMTLTASEVKCLYHEHSGKFFYNRLITFMRSGPVAVYVLARVNAIEEWRKLMGPTKAYQAQYTAPESIRGKYGLTDTRNAVHGSDSQTSALREMSILYPEFEPTKWMENNKTRVLNKIVK